MTDMLTAPTEALTASEAQQLEELEAVIDRAVQSFLEIGRALDQVREGRLYRASHDTFEAYCAERWGLGRSYAYEVIQAAQAADAVSGMPDIPAPKSQRVAAELVPLKDDQEAMVQTWSEAVQAHGPTPTAAQVGEIRQAKRPKPSEVREPPGDPERDTRYEVIGDAVELLRLMPSPEACVFPETRGEVESLDEAIRWLADWSPRVMRAWRAHRAFLRQRSREG